MGKKSIRRTVVSQYTKIPKKSYANHIITMARRKNDDEDFQLENDTYDLTIKLENGLIYINKKISYIATSGFWSIVLIAAHYFSQSL